jgi:hypothetical protein
MHVGTYFGIISNESDSMSRINRTTTKIARSNSHDIGKNKLGGYESTS